MKLGGLFLQQDQAEFVKALCKPASMPEPEPDKREPSVQPAKSREMRSMTGSLHWGNGGTRPDESFATSQLQRKNAAPLLSDHKRAVQNIKSLRGQPEISLRCRPLSTKMCVLAYTDSALHNADADTANEGPFMSGWQRQNRRVSGFVLNMVPWSVW